MTPRERRARDILMSLGMIFVLTAVALPLPAAAQGSLVKLSVFNFGVVNIDASGYGTTVSNMLINSLSADPSLVILDRKELESFLSLNDLQQNDDLNNMANIGSRLGLDMIVAGNVEKRGAVITIRTHVVQVD
ncbi:MAG: CsgG/HfaB family protein, partial [Syntrophales bacterium]|nr:CsgG/HfaB family protein [Syntrophales bacterium]